MAMLLMVLSIAGSILLTPFLMLLVCIIFLASIGKSLGVRRLYVKTLLMIFEYGRKDIESSLNHRNKEVPEDIDEGYSEEITQSEKSAEEPPLANGLVNGGNNVISRDEGLIFVPEPPTSKTEEAVKEEKFKDYELSNVFEYVKAGVEAIIEDQVTSRFEAEELKNWNLLIRTNRGYEFISWKLTFLWLGGFFIRYFFLFPLRLIICCFGIGQRHGGFLGIFQRALARASPHIWFERSETRDRSAVANRLKEHVSNPKNPPILIFPEGTCINNTSVMQFKKGSFEVGSVIYPVAIKYDPRFGDAFWNSSRFSMVQYLYMMMTSWAIVCDVWYLPPMYQRENESAIDFANRVKSVIAKQGGLVDLVWDGGLKRVKAKKEWKERQQEEFSRRLKAE
ncbi:glycerol-3-phosphate acyltransferase 3 isoform X3 [Diabrotica virgifera virgifera]|uniref:Phospholipid/glycerol acyltransferase domain-containing protein n=1 Tax=Diabrotica virgifera virgifera TaxID=50390 RepID=A0ABM5K6J5_DIAVI|nr:glycerol-3-phosphate acyltransferase 3 isoform X3 [Diabrotica virgifera virgifera]